MAITFPTDPTTGQEYVADNSVTYQWTGSVWSTLVPWLAGRSQYVADGGAAEQTYNNTLDNTIDGGNGA
jgi:hypothetical protein